jgi:hypothetical protein
MGTQGTHWLRVAAPESVGWQGVAGNRLAASASSALARRGETRRAWDWQQRLCGQRQRRMVGDGLGSTGTYRIGMARLGPLGLGVAAVVMIGPVRLVTACNGAAALATIVTARLVVNSGARQQRRAMAMRVEDWLAKAALASAGLVGFARLDSAAWVYRGAVGTR